MKEIKKSKKEYISSIVAGLLLIFLGIIFQVSNLATGIIPLIFMNAGTILIVIAVITYNKYGAGIRQDERTRMLGSRALAYSWLLTFVLANMLFWIDYTNLISFNTNVIFGIIIFTMTLSAGIFQYILSKKGVINEN